MSEQPSLRNNTSDEIDLGQLMQIIKNAFKSLGNFVLRIFLFFKKYLFVLFGLILLGVGISYGLNQLTSQKLKSEVLVRPNFESTDYLEDIVNEIKTNLVTKDESFFKELGVATDDLKGFDIELETIAGEVETSNEKLMSQMRYLEALNNFKDQGFVMDILRSELSEQSVTNYKLTFLYVDSKKGREIADKLMDYINTNEYFNGIRETYAANANARIASNKNLITQIDDVVANYSNSLKQIENTRSDNIIYSDKETIRVESLLELKKKLIEDNEAKNLELKQQAEVISILNYGKTQQVIKPFFNDKFFKIPFVLVLGFLLYCFIRYLNTKSKELS